MKHQAIPDYAFPMDREVWIMVAWIVGKPVKNAPSIAEQMAATSRFG
jgi:hypothetical protein